MIRIISKRKVWQFSALILVGGVLLAQAPGTVITVAGNANAGFTGDGGPATSASIYFPAGVAVDAAGSFYFGDTGNHRIRKVSPDGIITTVGGTGGQPFNGDGILATGAALSNPFGISVDAAGNLFTGDPYNFRIRKISTSGIITTVAGTGVGGFSGDGGPAVSAMLANPYCVTADNLGNLFIADAFNHRIRKVSPDGIIVTIAGNGTEGFSGDGDLATKASLSRPYCMALDTAGNLFIADTGNSRIRKLSPAGIITTVAGNGIATFAGDNGPATSASLSFPASVAIDAVGSLYIADTMNSQIRKVSPAGIITTVVGNGTLPTPNASLYAPNGVALDGAGNLLIGDTGNQRILKLFNEDLTPAVIEPVLTGTLGANGWYTSKVTVNWMVTDPESGIKSKIGCDSVEIPGDTPGTTLTCTATNGAGLLSSKSITIKIDKTAPLITGLPAAGTCSIWPPNKKLVQVADVTAVDSLSGVAAGSLKVNATSNEPSYPNDPDIVIAPDGNGGFKIQLRADRLGIGNGRVYSLNASAVDVAGNSVTATASCVVPHDQGK